MDHEKSNEQIAGSTPAAGNSPLVRFQHGGMSAAVFARELSTKAGDVFTKYSVGIDRSYKDAAGEWQNSDTLWLQESELHRAALCLLESLDEIRKFKRSEAADGAENASA